MYEWILKYWLEVLFGAICAVLAWAYNRLAKKFRQSNEERLAVREGLVAILHDRIYAECTRCLLENGVSVEDMRNIEYLYNAYHALGGNGTGTELFRRVRALPIGDGATQK